MNIILRKYELMKELGIKSCVERINTGDDRIFWNIHALGWSSDIITPIAAAILERACREWLEKEQSIYITADDQGFYYAFYMQRSTDPITGIECEYDAAQIEALEYCLKERNKQCTED